MRRFLSRVWIFVLTFGLGISVSALWRIYTLPALPKAIEVTKPELTVVTPAERLIVSEMHACGPKANYHVYQLIDGEHIVVTCETFESPSAAARALKRRMKSTEIVERFPNFDNGRPSGETVVVAGERAIEFTIEGKSLCETSASSLAQLKRFKYR